MAGLARWRCGLILVVSVGFAGGSAAAPPAEATKKPDAAGFPNTPEGAYKTFILAMATGDEPALRGITLSPEGIDWLLAGEHLPPERVGAFRQAVVDKLQIRRLKAGEQIKLPGGRVTRVKAEEVGADRAVLMSEGMPVPTRCVRVKGRWRVDARPVVASRRAAGAAKGQATPAQPPAAEEKSKATKK
jgi:hypothetical protein